MPNAEGCGAISRALLSVCGGEKADSTTALFDYLNCNIVPGCPGGQVERADVQACVAAIEAQRGADGSNKPRLLECRDALAVECVIARTDCGGAEETPAGGVVGFWTACDRLRTAIGYSCLVTESIRDAVVTQAAGDAAREASLADEASLDACMELLDCGRAGAFSDSAVALLVSSLEGTPPLEGEACTTARAAVEAATIDTAFCAPMIDPVVTATVTTP